MTSLIFFGLYGVLADKATRAAQFPDAVASVMVERYGGIIDTWRDAYRRVLVDWDSYYADLNLSGDDSEEVIAALWEGEYRTTRALFRLSNVPEPAQPDLTALSRVLNDLAARRCDLIPTATKNALRALHAAGYALGVASLTTAAQARGVLEGAGVLPLFDASKAIIAPDVVERFDRDAIFYTAAARRAGVDPAECWVIDSAPDALDGARSAGMQIARFDGDWDTLVHKLTQTGIKPRAP